MCRQVFIDQLTGEKILLGPTCEAYLPNYPATVMCSMFAQLTSAHGSYELQVQLQDMEGNMVWQGPQVSWAARDPLQVGDVIVSNLLVAFPAAGKYDVVLLANNQEIARVVFWASHTRAQRKE
jgi:hypothetical protein